MPKFYDEIPGRLLEWIAEQHMFFVATAPLNEHGHVNVSPKGTADCFHVVNPKQVWYEDLSGSGIETVSHIRENGRITIMFCAFEGPARIVRLWGVGTVHEYGTPEYNRLIPPTSRKPGSRSAIVIDVYQAGMSCGAGVPLYHFVMQRTQLLRFQDRLEQVDRERAAALASGDQHAALGNGHAVSDADIRNGKNITVTLASGFSLRKYWLIRNLRSLDGLPGLLTAPDAILETTPQNNFDKGTARPMMRHVRGGGGRATEPEVRKWFGPGPVFVLGAASMFVITRIVNHLKG